MSEDVSQRKGATPSPLAGDDCHAIYLRVKRSRADENEEDHPCAALEPLPPAIRLRWEAAEMGDAPFRARSIDRDGVGSPPADEQTLVFERVSSAIPGTVVTSAFEHKGPLSQPTCADLHITGVKRLRDGVVIECIDDAGKSEEAAGRDCHCRQEKTTAPLSSDRWDVYVASSHTGAASGAGERDVKDEFSFEGLTVVDGAAALLPSAVRCMGVGQARELPTVTLRPRKRAKTEDEGQGVGAWGDIRDASELTIATWLQEELRTLALTDEAARAQAQADLYCYPDHRHDDEYDSNAEDFSGNDYPDEKDSSSHEGGEEGRKDAESDSLSRDSDEEPRREHGEYGMYYEEGYHERPLARGWGSDDDDVSNAEGW